MNGSLSDRVAAWSARTRAAFESSGPLRWYRDVVGRYVAKRVAWWWLRLVVSLVRVALVAAVAWYAWRLELVALLPFPDYRVWTFEYVAWVSVVFAALFTLSLPGFIVMRALRGTILSGAVVALPLGLFALYMSLAHRLDVFLPRTGYYVAAGWKAGNTVPWLLGGFVVALHLA